MKIYRIKVFIYLPYKKEKEYNIEASSVHTAIARAVKQFKKEVIGKKQWDKFNIEVYSHINLKVEDNT